MTLQLQRLMLKLLPRPMGEGALGSSHPVLSSSSTARKQATQVAPLSRAYSYPIATLSRTMNPYSNDILEYKNAHGKIIILYDDDERLASQAATTMCERGFENLFMLSGGLKVLAQKFPEGLVTGALPASCQQVLPHASARKRSSPKMPPLPAENKWRFTPEDLKKIECYLEAEQGLADNHSRTNQNNSGGRDLKVPAGRSGQNLPTGGPAGHSNPRTPNSGHLQGKPWK